MENFCTSFFLLYLLRCRHHHCCCSRANCKLKKCIHTYINIALFPTFVSRSHSFSLFWPRLFSLSLSPAPLSSDFFKFSISFSPHLCLSVGLQHYTCARMCVQSSAMCVRCMFMISTQCYFEMR